MKKRKIAFILLGIIVLLLTACNDLNIKMNRKTKKDFELSQEAYNNIKNAYDIIEPMSSDIYEAWRLGIYEKKNMNFELLAKELHLSEDELRDGAVALLMDLNDEVDEQKEEEYKELSDYMFTLFKDDLFSFCVKITSNAYKKNGKIDEAKEYLETAKISMKELSNKYSDYEHYPNLKGYYTTVNALFDFIQNPQGSFEQVKTTINDYRNDIRKYTNDLDYIFEADSEGF